MDKSLTTSTGSCPKMKSPMIEMNSSVCLEIISFRTRESSMPVTSSKLLFDKLTNPLSTIEGIFSSENWRSGFTGF